MWSCCVKAGNLIMDAVIYSSHGRYLAPGKRMLGEGLVDIMIEEGKEQQMTRVMRKLETCHLFSI